MIFLGYECSSTNTLTQLHHDFKQSSYFNSPSALGKPRPLIAAAAELVHCYLEERQLTGSLPISRDGGGCLDDHGEGQLPNLAEFLLL